MPKIHLVIGLLCTQAFNHQLERESWQSNELLIDHDMREALESTTKKALPTA